jgi:pimeloyl-ACP methyl ester carboxylesterase
MIYFTERGKEHGGPPLILLHGFCETHSLWNSFQEELGRQFHVLCPDLPGFGSSSFPAKNFKLTDIAEELWDWLEEESLEEVVLVGHSLGGYVALAMLELEPHRVLGVGMFHSTAYADTEEKKRSRNNVIQFVEKHGVEKFVTSFVPQLFYAPNRVNLENEIEKTVEEAATTPQETLIGFTKAMQKRPARLSYLRKFAGPVVYIIGEQDSTVPLADSLAQVQALPNCLSLVLPETGHMGMYERPKESRHVLQQFMAAIAEVE